MKIYKSLHSLAFILLFCSSVFSQPSRIDGISEDRLRDHIFFLASDSLKGRGINSPEINRAADYIKNQLQNMHVSTPGDGYFQSFTLTSASADKKNSFIKVLNRRGKEKKHIESFIAFNQNSNNTDIEGDLVFAGFGTGALFTGENDSAGIDCKGKIILFSAGTPESFREEGSYRLNNSLERKKMTAMQNAGARALILVTSLQDTANVLYHQILRTAEMRKISLGEPHRSKLPDVFVITPQTAAKLTGHKLNWKKALTLVSENKKKDYPSLLQTTVHIKSVLKEEKVQAKNILAVVEGSDPELRNECIVFVAHYDHLGTDADGNIYNGADDNSSGVAVLIELAGLFQELALKPKRSIVFLFPTAEEAGLFGSEFYSQNPLFPMRKTIACINLDMVGRVYEPRDSVWDHSPKQVKNFSGIYALVNDFNTGIKNLTEDLCAQLGMEPDFRLGGQFFYTSDHYHFHLNQVPVLNLSTGYTADYHKPSDTAERIRTDKMKRVAQLGFLMGMKLGNGE